MDADHRGAWVSVDGESWDRAPGIESVITKWETEGAGRYGGTIVVGNTLFWAVAEAEGAPQRRDLWVIEFDSASAAAATP